MITKRFHYNGAASALIIISVCCAANADINGIPYNGRFPDARYPYAKAPNGCGPGFTRDRREIRDTWGPVDFTGACNTHDKCYYTNNSDWNTCNERFYSDLRAACERDLRIPVSRPNPSLTNPLRTKVVVYLPPDPVRLGACYSIASSYYAGVQLGVAIDVFKDAQALQKAYTEWTASLGGPVLSSGFYKEKDRSEIYLVNSASRTICHVQNPSQMEVFGGFTQVRSMSSGSFRSGTQFTGKCRWPDGLYRSRERPEVYYLHGNGSLTCWVRSSERVGQLGGWAKVRLIKDTTLQSLAEGRRYSDAC
jgi:hypothetical protein